MKHRFLLFLPIPAPPPLPSSLVLSRRRNDALHPFTAICIITFYFISFTCIIIPPPSLYLRLSISFSTPGAPLPPPKRDYSSRKKNSPRVAPSPSTRGLEFRDPRAHRPASPASIRYFNRKGTAE